MPSILDYSSKANAERARQSQAKRQSQGGGGRPQRDADVSTSTEFGWWVEREWWRKVVPLAAAAGVAAVACPWPELGQSLLHFGQDLYADAGRQPYVNVAWEGGGGRDAWVQGGALTAAALAALPLTWGAVCERRIGEGRWTSITNRRRRKRLFAEFRQRWDRAQVRQRLYGHNRSRSRIVRVGFNGVGDFVAKVKLGDGMHIGMYDTAERRRLIGQALGLGGSYGYPVDVIFEEPYEDTTAYMDVRVIYEGLPNPWDIEPDTDAAPDDSHLRLGIGRDGWILWDLDDNAHLKVNGPPGKGKGRTARRLVWQAAAAGWDVIIWEGQGSPEYTQFGRIPNVTYEKFRPSRALEGVERVIDQAWELLKRGEAVSDLCDQEGVERWADLPPEVRPPRTLVVIDEPDPFISKRGKGSPGEDERKELGAILATILRQVRKFGINVIFIDQITYASTNLGDGALGMIERWMYLGAPPPNWVWMVAHTHDVPKVRNERARGLTGVGGTDIQEHVQPGGFSLELLTSLIDDMVGVEAEEPVAA